MNWSVRAERIDRLYRQWMRSLGVWDLDSWEIRIWAAKSVDGNTSVIRGSWLTVKV